MPPLCQVILTKPCRGLLLCQQNEVQDHVEHFHCLLLRSSLQLQSFGLLLQDHLPVFGLVFQTSTREVLGLPGQEHARAHRTQYVWVSSPM